MATPFSSLRGFASLLGLLLTPAGCSGGDTGTDGRLSPVDVVVRGCETPCANADARYACIEEACADVYAKCFGGSYRSGDYTGGVCESGLECLASSPVACEADCSPTPTCFDCVANELVTCAQSSECPALDCPD